MSEERLRRGVTLGDLATALHVSREWAWDVECLSEQMSAREQLTLMHIVDRIAPAPAENPRVVCTCRLANCAHMQAVSDARTKREFTAIPPPDVRLLAIASEICAEAVCAL